MAKCPKCNSRKGKRHCPALDTAICSTCCGENRLRSIPCPSDCEYLAGEEYQKARRMERARHQGRSFLEALYETFADQSDGELAFRLHVDMVAFVGSEQVGDEEAIASFATLQGMYAPILVPSASQPTPLAQFLKSQLDSHPDYVNLVRRCRRPLSDLCGRLKRFAESFDGGYMDAVNGFFGHLQLEQDLHYSPTDPGEDGSSSPQGFKRRPDGLILPQ